jgi:hypothetical protein
MTDTQLSGTTQVRIESLGNNRFQATPVEKTDDKKSEAGKKSPIGAFAPAKTNIEKFAEGIKMPGVKKK